MRIRIKIKHLVLATASAVILLSCYLTVIEPALNRYAAEQTIEQGGVPAMETLLARLANAKDGKDKWELIRTYILEDGGDSIVNGFDVRIGPGTSQSTGSAEPKKPQLAWEEKLPYLEAYAESGPADGYLPRAAKQLVMYYNANRQPELAINVLERVRGRIADSWQSAQLGIDQAKLLTSMGRDEEASAILDQVLASNEKSRNYTMLQQLTELQATLLLRKGSIDEAIAKVKADTAAYKRELEQLKPDAAGAKNDQASFQLEALQRLAEQLETSRYEQGGGIELSSVSGTVKRSDGKPLGQIGVYLRQEGAVNHSVTEDEPYQVLTDAHGHFVFPDVLPGYYQLFIGLDYEQIDGWAWAVRANEWIEVKSGESLSRSVTLEPLIAIVEPVNNEEITGESVHFEWEPVDGAAYYELSGNIHIDGSSSGTLIRGRIKDHRADVPLTELEASGGGIQYKSVDGTPKGKQIPDPISLLGFAYREGKFSWSVEAFRADGTMISRSNGYRLNAETVGELPFFRLPGRSLTEADRLLLADRFAEALTAYKKEAEANPEDTHSLRMILRSYDAKSSMDGRSATGEEATIPYLKRLYALVPSDRYLFRLFDYEARTRNWTEAEKYYASYVARNPDKDHSYEDAIYASGLLEQGKYAESRELLLASVQADGSHRFVGNLLAAELLLSDGFESALELAMLYPEHNFGQTPANWLAQLQAMKQEAAGKRDYQSQLRQAIEWHFSGNESKLKAWRTDSDRAAMKVFLNMLEEVG
ncbi:hypothetical protein ACFFSY_23320 [Paenibacillus aurantiacus]|uniref:Carboxypeptidase regulatory-like domain-containing protein n=1 Tax=Paenibacillus aurantiacus TaxID=1936118 RepID=A0ABV5KUH2_9BACL